MEISSFPFLNQEDHSYHYSLFQEMENFNVNKNSIKRRRKESGGGNKEETTENALKDMLLSSLVLLGEEEKQDQEQRWVLDAQQDKALFEADNEEKTPAMNDFYSQLENIFSDLDQVDSSRTKRARWSPVSAATAAAADNAGSNSSPPQDAAASGAGGQPHHRRLWVKDRSKDWWDQHNHPEFPEEEFRRAFRMSKATFNMICDELEAVVTKKNTMLREAIPVRQRVAVCIWRLATGEPLRVVSKRFGLGISTCHKLVLEVCSAIRSVLMPKFLQWPDENRLRMIKDEFQLISGIPNIGGSMYTTHAPIIAPKVNVASYFNKRHTERNHKTSYSITVQGVVDPKGVFTDVCIGWPGSMPDDQVLEKSALSQRAQMGLLKDVWVVGNSGHPLKDWVLVPYTHQNLTWCQHAFNEKVGEVQRVAKEAFARLKGRWSCLQKRTEVKLQDLPVVLGACCVLHNICEMRNEETDPEHSFELFDDEMMADNSLSSVSSTQARDLIAHDLLHRGQAGTRYTFDL
ncbi:protein ALP1-like [Carya illinoinensis]|uniref:protein ALP1-like n=1 Tax=Carya illinoinensis TaxID=32201 RepID=UPI001C7279D8|nr:protein ALP1-like [Carya illinoinensis]